MLRQAIDAAARRFDAGADRLYAEAQKTRLDIITLVATLLLAGLALVVTIAQIRMAFFR